MYFHYFRHGNSVSVIFIRRPYIVNHLNRTHTEDMWRLFAFFSSQHWMTKSRCNIKTREGRIIDFFFSFSEPKKQKNQKEMESEERRSLLCSGSAPRRFCVMDISTYLVTDDKHINSKNLLTLQDQL